MAKIKDNCPYCKKNCCIPNIAFLNCEMYGNHCYTVQCNHCKKVINISLERIVIINTINKSDKTKEDCDW